MINTFFFCLLLFTLTGYSQINREWIRHYEGGEAGHDKARHMALDESGSLYITGKSYNSSGSYDLITLKYSSSGSLLWAKVYDTGLEEEGLSVTLSGNPLNVVVTGEVKDYLSTFKKIVTIKYSGDGAELWSRTFFNGCCDIPKKIKTDHSGNIFVAGLTSDVNTCREDFLLLKYSAEGDLLWSRTYSGDNPSSIDKAFDLAVDGAGSCYITGVKSQYGGLEKFDIATIKYDSDGSRQWVRVYSGSSNESDYPNSIKLDRSGNIIIAGSAQGDCLLLWYNTSGELIRAVTQSVTGEDQFMDMEIDGQDNIFLTGFRDNLLSGNDFITCKYSPGGIKLWEKDFNSPMNMWDIAEDIALDRMGNVYITGRSGRPPLGNPDYYVVKYESDGSYKWSEFYNGALSMEDEPKTIAVDSSFNVYVTGFSRELFNHTKITTLKYSQLTGITNTTGGIPAGFLLSQNYPNPFNPVTSIEFEVPKTAYVKLTVFDILGREVETLADSQMPPGIYKAEWNAGTNPSGVYFYKLAAGDFSDVKKMILTR